MVGIASTAETEQQHIADEFVQLPDGSYVRKDRAQKIWTEAKEHRKEWEAEQERAAEDGRKQEATAREWAAARKILRDRLEEQLGDESGQHRRSNKSVVAARQGDQHPLSETFQEVVRKHGEQRYELGRVLSRVVALLDEWWRAECANAREAYTRMSPAEKLEFQLWLLERNDD